MAENKEFVDLLASLTTYLKSTPHPKVELNNDLWMEMDKACKKLSATTRTLFGPQGWRKLVFTSKEYKMLLNGIVVEHPTAKLLIQVAKLQQEKFGDGANLVVLIAGQLIEGAIELINLGMNPSEIINGYKTASKKLDAILDSLVHPMDVRDAEVIQFMKASFVSSNAENHERCMLEEDILCPLIAEACIQVCPKNPLNFNVENVRVARLLGVSLDASKTFRGMVLKVDTVVGSIKGIEDAQVLVIAGDVDTTDSEQLEDVITASRAKVIVSGAGVGQKALQFCDDNKIMVLKIASKSELDCFCRTTQAVALLKLGSTVDPNYLGHVDSILVEKTHGDRVTVTTKEGGVATILLGASTDIRYYEQLERAVVCGVNTYKALCRDRRDGRIVPGAGATEFEIARQLRVFACKETGSSSDAIRKYAESFELIPKTLAENSYLDVEDIMKNLKADHEAGKFKVGIDVEEGVCKDASTLKIWDLYTTKYQALKYATAAVCMALREVTKTQSIFSSLTEARNFLVTYKQNEDRNSELVASLNDIMLSDKDFKKENWKWLGDVVEVGGNIVGLSPKGYLYSCDKVSKKISSWDVLDILPTPILEDYSYIVNSYIMTVSDRVKTKDNVIPVNEKLVQKFTSSSNIGNCTMSKLVEERYVHGGDVCVRRCDIVLRWFEEGKQNPVEGRMKDSVCELMIALFDVSILNDNQFIREEYSFPPGEHDVKWLAERKGRIVEQQLNINMVCVEKTTVDYAPVRKLVSSLQHISHTSSNILMVHDVYLSDNVFHFSVERFGMPLTKFINSHAISHKNMLKLIRGLVNGMRALHINKVAIGNLKREDIFVDDNWNVKIAPINQSRKFHASASTSTSKIKLIKKVSPITELEANMEADMKGVGKIIFWCYTKRPKYNDECRYYPLPKPIEYMKNINTYVVDFLHQLLHQDATAIDAATNYIFWTKEKSCDFIRAVSERLDAIDSSHRPYLEKGKTSILGLDKDGQVIDWIPKFPAQFITIMKTDKNGVPLNNSDQNYEYKGKGKSIYHLYHIVRNLLSHEDSTRQRVAGVRFPKPDLEEMFDIEKGIFSFLIKLFPMMIREPYYHLKDRLKEDHRFTKFYKQFNPDCE